MTERLVEFSPHSIKGSQPRTENIPQSVWHQPTLTVWEIQEDTLTGKPSLGSGPEPV